MAINNSLFEAILAMDSYNRGYNQGVDFGVGSDAVGTSIGNATIFATEDGALGNPESFYAVAYDLDGSGSGTDKVISFRGTDNFVDDLSTGFGVGAGSEGNVQGLLAADFYDTVSGGNLSG